MPKPQQLTRRQRWAPYVRKLADILHLRDWRVDVNEESPADSNAWASCCPIEGRKCAEVRLSESFLNDEKIDQRQTITHELLHCHLGPMWRVIEAEGNATAAAKLAMEYCVDGLADAIAPLLPEPPASTRSQH
jgi:hypothetical protein